MALFILVGIVFLVWRYLKWSRKHSHAGNAEAGGEGTTKKRVSAFSKMRAKKEERAKRQQELV